MGLFDLSDVSPTAAEVAGTGRRVGKASGDVSRVGDVCRAVQGVRGAFGPVVRLVNNSGIVDNVAPLARMSPEAWHRKAVVNLTVAFLMMQEVRPDMLAAGWGRIVHISSVAARGGLFDQSAFAANRSGLIGLTHTAALE